VAKHFCIDSIETALTENGDESKLANSVRAWLSKLESGAVVEVHKKLREQLSHKNGWVTETNETIANCKGGSMNAILLGNTQQSKAALFCVAPCVCKNKVALEQCLNVLKNVQSHISSKHPSTADDAGTKKRTVQHLFSRVLNTPCTHMEVSDTQVALISLNMGSEVTSDTFTHCGSDNSVNFLKHEINLEKQGLPLFAASRDMSMEDRDYANWSMHGDGSSTGPGGTSEGS
jgi:hypothetical protein